MSRKGRPATARASFLARGGWAQRFPRYPGQVKDPLFSSAGQVAGTWEEGAVHLYVPVCGIMMCHSVMCVLVRDSDQAGLSPAQARA